jgi:hypothetical protein
MPPKHFIPKNTATREFFSTDETDAPPDEVDCASSADSSPTIRAQKTGGEEKKDVAEDPGKKVLISPKGREEARETSPTPSDIVLNADMEDVGALGEMNRKMRDDGVSVEERKERLREMQGELVERREEGWEKAKRGGSGDAWWRRR